MPSEPVSYDLRIIQEAADRLYRQAKSAVVSSAILGLIIGGVAGAAFAASMKGAEGNTAGYTALACILIGGLIGYVRGKERAFAFKLQAQVALCQAQIETNTRGDLSARRAAGT